MFSYEPLNKDVQLFDNQLESLQQLSPDTGCSLEDLPEAMEDRDEWQEWVWEIRASSTIMMIMMQIHFCFK